jgi:hypothetical protein
MYSSLRSQTPICNGDRIGLLAGRGLLVIEVIGRHNAAAALKRIAERRLALNPLGFGVDIREADVDVLGPVRDQTPAQKVQAALAGLAIVPDHREQVSGCRVPTGREVRGRSMRRDGKDELDFADIRRQANAATHAEMIAV